MRPTLREILAAFGRPLALLPFFTILYLLGSLTGMLEHTLHCFPMTLITTNAAVAQRIAALPETCSALVETERFMIENAIFNDTDLPPVRDIYLVTIEAPFTAWETLEREPEAIAEMNPFLKRVAELYLDGRLKMFAVSFVIGLVVAVLTFPIALPRRTPFRRLDRASRSFSGLIFLVLLIGGLPLMPAIFRSTYLLATAAGLGFALVLRILNRKYEEKNGGAI